MFKPMFVPPRENPVVLSLANALLPLVARLMGGISDVRVENDDFRHLEALRDSRAILAPNHPTGYDPFVLFWLSRELRQPFNYLACREILEGPKGWVMNRLGTYSVIRGVADRESLRTTRRLLAELDRKLVIFPEGEVYEHNDKLLSFQSGVAQIGFWVLEDLQKLGKPPVLPLVPLAIKYRCSDAPRPAIHNSLRDLERALSLPSDPNLTSYARLRRVGDRVLGTLEREVDLHPSEGETLGTRMMAVRQAVLNRVAQAVQADISAHQPVQEQLHLLFHALKSWVGVLPDNAADYDERLYRRKMEIAAPLFRDLQRLQNFIAMSDDYIAAEATAERFLDVLGRLEVEVFGEVRHRVPREAMVRIAPPIRLEERLEAYRRRKREVVAEVTYELESSIRTMLGQLSSTGTPLALEA